MDRVKMSLLRGICQIPAYVAHDKGFFEDAGVDLGLDIVATAWQIPDRLSRRVCDFAVLPWTRVVLEATRGRSLVLVCGSGREEAAIVVRNGIRVADVRKVALPKRGGLKDLTALALMESLGWSDVEEVRQPSGDGAILALVGAGADAASMIEPFATVMEQQGIGSVVKRTGDVWPNAPGCSLTTTSAAIEQDPEMVQGVVDAFVRGIRFIDQNRDEASEIASPYIGVSPEFIKKALIHNHPDVDALSHDEAMKGMLSMMMKLGYLDRVPEGYLDLSFLETARTRF
jgi:ABC-type nitrate/sulfonate/bicarbonate transport system substrate-binding protein